MVSRPYEGNPVHLLNMTFTTSQVSEITGVSADAVQNWIKRGLIVGHRPTGEATFEGGGSQGRHRQFSYFAVMQFAMAGALVKATVGAADAAKGAVEFAHIGGGGKVFGLPDRLPGLPFHHNRGETVFGFTPSRSFEELWEADKPDGNGRDTFGHLRRILGPTFVVVDASEVFRSVCAGIGRLTGQPRDFEYRKLLDEAYPEDAKG